jgi:hypothetical protein
VREITIDATIERQLLVASGTAPWEQIFSYGQLQCNYLVIEYNRTGSINNK